MPKYIVKISGQSKEWVIEAPNSYDAKEDALETYLAHNDEYLDVEVEEIEEDTVRHDRLQMLLEQLVEGFNDCACCPLSNECKRREDYAIDSIACAKSIRMYYLEQETDWGIG